MFVIGLIGERGREVREFIDLELDEVTRQKCVLVVATSDKPVGEQVQAAYVAQTVAEYFRNQGKKVVLFMDSLSRFARAKREIGLGAGEKLSRGGYPASVFIALQKLLERAGNSEHGSITAFYTVLMESDDFTQDAVSDEVKAVVDGHIVFNRELVEQDHFPAIDLLKSLSRLADRVMGQEHLKAYRKLRQLISKYEEIKFLIQVGEYKPGGDLLADEAVRKYPKIMALVKQDRRVNSHFITNLQKMLTIAKE